MAEQKNPMRKWAFVIGAGMSAECGAPVISQFLKVPFTNLVKGKRLNLLQKFISSAYPEGAAPNIEEVLSRVDHAIVKREPLAGYSSHKLQEVRQAITYVITEVLAKVWDKLNKDFGANKQDNPYAILLSKKEEREALVIEKNIRNMSSMIDRTKYSTLKLSPEANGWIDTYGRLAYFLHSGDTVITFNYDLFLDLALSISKLGWQIDYGTNFAELVPDEDIQCVGAPLRYVDRPMSGKAEKIITVLKMHGANNWAFCSSCNTMVVTDLAPFLRVNRYIRELQNSPPDLKKYLCCPNFSLEPLIVPPTWMKEYDNRSLADIWSVAKRKLADATVVLFLGYSFSESDFQIRHLFNGALHLRSGKPWDKIVVVNSNIGGVLPIYKRYFGKVEPFKRKVSDYLRQQLGK
jgi:hypothetical protein